MAVFFNIFAAAEPSANVCVAPGTRCNDPNVYLVSITNEFRPRLFPSALAEPLAATREP